MDAEVEARVLDLRRAHPGWGPLRLRHALERDGVEPVPGRSSIYRALVRGGVIDPRPRRRKRYWRRWERANAMELWQLDVMGARLVDGTWFRVVTGLDDHSRFCIIARAVPKATAAAVCEAFAEAMRRYGVPEGVLTDNGKVFTARFGPHRGRVLFDRICQENGIRHLLTSPGSPTTTGKIERLHKTLRTELLAEEAPASIEEAQAALDRYVEHYNALRPHQALGMATPAERFRVGASSPGRPREPQTPAQSGRMPKDRWGCVEEKMLPPGTCTIEGTFRAANGGPAARAEATYQDRRVEARRNPEPYPHAPGRHRLFLAGC